LGTNICGFTALPGGGGNITSAWKYDRGETSWWTSTLTESGLAEIYDMRLYINGYGNGFENWGTNDLGMYLIRCVKD
jgi:hypothetical protein